mgnify:FL=1
MVIDLENKIHQIYREPSDINLHIPVIIELAKECDTITEMGVRGIVSTWAWLAGNPKNGLISYDLSNPSNWGGKIEDVYETAEAYGIPFKFVETNVLEIEIEETDLLFIDTWHCYDQLKLELKLHADKAKKYICFHDTTTFAHTQEPLSSAPTWKGELTPNKGLWDAVTEFLETNSEIWELKKRYEFNNGFSIIKRK